MSEKRECSRIDGEKKTALIKKDSAKEVKGFLKDVSIEYIDYKKAYDMVPHSWILEMMNVTGIAKNMGLLIRNSMGSWRTELNSEHDSAEYLIWKFLKAPVVHE